MKGVWGKVSKWSLGALGIAVVALITHVIQNGELPIWLSGALRWLSSLMQAQTYWAFWEILTIFLSPCIVLGVLVFMLMRKNSVDVDDFNRQNTELRGLRTSSESLERINSELTLSNAGLTARNAELEASHAKLAQGQSEMPDLAFKLLATIAQFIDADIRPTLRTIRTTLNVGSIEAQGAIDVLLDQKFLSLAITGDGIAYEFSPKGRAYYLKHKA